VFGAVMSSSAQSSYDKFDTAIANCNDMAQGMGCVVDSSISGIRDSGDTKKTVAYIGYGLAGAAIVAGSALLYLNRRTSYEITADQYRKELAKKPKVSVMPVVAPNTAGAVAIGSF
jgi:hypothetical protein